MKDTIPEQDTPPLAKLHIVIDIGGHLSLSFSGMSTALLGALDVARKEILDSFTEINIK